MQSNPVRGAREGVTDWIFKRSNNGAEGFRMKCLLDTHVLLWAAAGKLSPLAAGYDFDALKPYISIVKIIRLWTHYE